MINLLLYSRAGFVFPYFKVKIIPSSLLAMIKFPIVSGNTHLKPGGN
jgi:hypothetical protein